MSEVKTVLADGIAPQEGAMVYAVVDIEIDNQIQGMVLTRKLLGFETLNIVRSSGNKSGPVSVPVCILEQKPGFFKPNQILSFRDGAFQAECFLLPSDRVYTTPQGAEMKRCELLMNRHAPTVSAIIEQQMNASRPLLHTARSRAKFLQSLNG